MTVVVWLVATAVVVVMLGSRRGDQEYYGLARALQYEISATTSGNLAAVLVDIYEPVEAGQVVARLDDAEIVARLETESALLDQLTAELEAESTRIGFREAGLVEDRRRFQVDEQQLHLEALSLRVVLESDQVELERRNLQLERARALAGDGVLSQDAFDDIRLGRDRLAKQIEENRVLLGQTEDEYRAAQARRVTYENQFPDLPDKDPVLQPLRDAVRAQERRLEEIQIQRRAVTLRSPVAGRVSQVAARLGQSVLPGEPLLFIMEQVASEIVAYAPESSAGRIVERSPVVAVRLENASVVAESIITRVGPSIEQMPQRMWRDPTVPEYGVPFVVAGVPTLRMTPGEMIGIQLIGN